MKFSHLLFAVALGLLAHAFVGYTAFPFGDDFAYAPLAEYRANPELFARDDQLKLFANHARVYDWVYGLGANTFGVEPVFRVAVWLLAVAAVLALTWCARALGAPFYTVPAALGLGVLVQMDGLGRGDFGGLISTFFHHHNVALVLVLGAIAAGLSRQAWLAGAFLGLAVFAQPMTAFHGAILAGLGALLRHPAEAFKMALAAIVVSLPAALPVLSSVLATPETEATIDLIPEAYRFRAPLHYDPAWPAIGLTTLYLLAGLAGALALWRRAPELGRFVLGVMAGFGLLHLVTVVIYKFGLLQWIGFFILDANRATALLFILGPLFALAAMAQGASRELMVATGGLLLAILAFNGTIAAVIFLLLAALFWRFQALPRFDPVMGLALLGGLILFFPAKPAPSVVPDETRVVLRQIREETPRDALFVIPVGLSEFRIIAQRSAYVDFKLFSVAQPDQASLTRTRIDEIVAPSAALADVGGWEAAVLLSEEQRQEATCARMQEVLSQTGATYFLRSLAEAEPPPDCPALGLVMASETLALYGPSR